MFTGWEMVTGGVESSQLGALWIHNSSWVCGMFVKLDAGDSIQVSHRLPLMPTIWFWERLNRQLTLSLVDMVEVMEGLENRHMKLTFSGQFSYLPRSATQGNLYPHPLINQERLRELSNRVSPIGQLHCTNSGLTIFETVLHTSVQLE